ncbi:hypothetical protein R6Q59_008624 [Mikania micrantha]|uniref:PWWP domain-containing protein n=1 Tax=Mikania micrantha TaxID=192012 RepID=A0A5N6Q784_9ASTR|nr:hypothetical protein E3N88_02927 [Mikania micrantha]
MMEPSFGYREDDLVDDCMVSGGKKGVVMESDERILTVFENKIDDWGSGMRLKGKVAGSGFVDDGKLGANLVESGVGSNVSKACGMRAINLVVDLSPRSRKESDHNVVESSGKKTNDVEFTEKEGEYGFSDLVWVKMKNHPWWPGQIINPSASTDEPAKHFKKEGFLIAYFGETKFALHELNEVKPFHINFSKMETQSKSEAFIHAVNHALHGVARRVELGLSCLCLSEEVCNKIKSQIVVNSGMRKESSRVDDGDRFYSINSFNPAKAVDVLLDFAKDPFGINRLDASTVEGQLSAFNRLKGYHHLQLNQILDEIDDKSNDTSSAFHSKGKLNYRGRPRKSKHLFESGISSRKNARCLSKLMSDGIDRVSGVEYKPKKRGRKRKVIESKGSNGENQCQSQIADEFLSQMYMAARNPIEGQHNLDSLHKFYSDFTNYRLTKNKNYEEIANESETLEADGFTGVKDSYWTDMTIVTESDISPKPNKENSATALTFKFTNLDCVPSVRKLHEIFRRYGALQETETRVLKKKKCVKLVFERKCDAETAFSSTGKFGIFGPALVSYRLNFSPKLKKTQRAERG